MMLLLPLLMLSLPPPPNPACLPPLSSSTYLTYLYRLLHEGYHKSKLTGDLPIASMLVRDDWSGKIMPNSVELDSSRSSGALGGFGAPRNPYLHAELLCLLDPPPPPPPHHHHPHPNPRAGNSVYSGTTLICTHEPCCMCMSALCSVGVSKVVFTGVDSLNGAFSNKLCEFDPVGLDDAGNEVFQSATGPSGTPLHWPVTLVKVDFEKVQTGWLEYLADLDISIPDGYYYGHQNALRSWWKDRRRMAKKNKKK